METTEVAELIAGVGLPVLLAAIVVFWFRHRRRDEVYDGITPGELPALGQQVARRRVARGSTQWSGPVAVRFTPPSGLTPGLVGTVIDGRADVVDVSATLVDLAVRGFVHLHAEAADPSIPPPPPRGPRSHPTRPPSSHDWRLTRLPDPPNARLAPFEQTLLDAVFAAGKEVTLRELKARGFDLTMREAQVGLYREVVDRGWYAKHPRDRNRRLGCLGIPLLLTGGGALGYTLLQLGSSPAYRLLLALGAGLLLAALLLIWGGRGRTPRTADGSAARIQALGFREYITTAEANQIRFEEARDLFSRYLPYAMVFVVADRWAATFAQVAAQAQREGLGPGLIDLGWIDGFGALSEILAAPLDVVSIVDGIDSLAAGFDVTEWGAGLGGVADSAGDFADAAGDLLDFGSGCLSCGDGC